VGLDITAYSNLEFASAHRVVWCEDENHIQTYAYDCFPRSFRGIPIRWTDTSIGRGGESFIQGGCFAATPRTEVHGFRAGSYGGYNQWREDLARQFNGPTITDADPDKPFYELIYFADNEGCIGPEAAADLFIDFTMHFGLYDPKCWYPDAARQSYGDWTRAFALAAENGLVVFH
jgi:hypothetical protein